MALLVPVTFEPSGATAWVEPGATVLEAAQVAGLGIPATCGGRATCGSCAVRVVAGELAAPASDESAALKNAHTGVRLACRGRVIGPVTVRPLVDQAAAVTSPAAFPSDGDLVAGVDLGTTNVAAAVIDARRGIEVGRALVANRQSSFGADVLSRLSAAAAGKGHELQRLAEESVTDALVGAVGHDAASRVVRVTIAGNTAMASLFSGADVTSLQAHPFATPRACCSARSDSSLARSIAPTARISVVEPIAGFAGGDLVAGIVALGLTSTAAPKLLVDIGTNAEVAVSIKGKLWVASAAAGPAFEGGGLRSGGPAVHGAVSGVSLVDDDVRLETIGGEPATWFSGAGLLSALALLRRTGHIDASGLMDAQGPLADRFYRGDDGVLLVRLGAGAGELELSQLDVRSLQLAKAAVRVAIESVLRAAKVPAQRLEVVHVSGAFGSALCPSDLIELGVVPRATQGRIRAAGNTALAGAVALANDLAGADAIGRITATAHHVDLAAQADFNAALVAALNLEPFSA